MSTAMRSILRPEQDNRQFLIKWIIALLVPLAVFTVLWGESIVNNVLLGLLAPGSSQYGSFFLIQAAIFVVLFYATVVALVGYLVAADSGRRSTIALWIDVVIFLLIPLLLISALNDLIFGLVGCAVLWAVYFAIRSRVPPVRRFLDYRITPPFASLEVSSAEQRDQLTQRAVMGSFWFASAFALLSLIVDLAFFFSGALPAILLIWVVFRTIALPVAGYFLGKLASRIVIRHAIALENNGEKSAHNPGESTIKVDKRRELRALSATRAREEAKDLVPNDLPLQSTGASRFYITLLIAFLLFYPVLDPFLFGYGTDGRLAGYSDAGRYVILALGLNVVVGFAGLLDLGYVAFFAIGAYVWGMFGSQQFHILTGITVDPHIWPWFFWPMIFVTAIIAAIWGVLLGAPTLRLRGDYLAIVTLGFGEIVPIVFLNMNKYTNGTNGIAGVYSPAFPGVDWNVSTPVPYYYLILALIALVIFANVRLRDSRLGRAWVAIREDEIAASSSGINLVQTKLFAFGTGAFFSGIAGAYYAAKLSGVSPDNFSFSDSVIYLAMVVIGGLGSIPGVIVGALVVYAINVLVLAQLDTLAADPSSFVYPLHQAIIQVLPGFTFNNIRNLVFGVILIVIMIFRPEGLLPSARRRRELHHTEEESAEISSLDVAPGEPGFEEEVRVE